MRTFTLAGAAFGAFAASLVLAGADTASAHFLWIAIEPGPLRSDAGASLHKAHAFLNEEPEPGSPEFLEHVAGVQLFVAGRLLPLAAGERSLEATWSGPLPRCIDAARDMGVRTRDGASHRLFYTARAQSGFDAGDGATGASGATGDGLRARVVARDGKALVEVTFDGKPVPNARIKIYPNDASAGEPSEMRADANGLADVPGVAKGTESLWANWVDATAGEIDGKPFTETRHYATLTYAPSPTADPVPFAIIPEPAVNAFGGALEGDWLYVYSGHVGRVHRYSVDTTAKHFRRLSLKDRTTWEDLPMGSDVQGVALVGDGRYLYRTGGMRAFNAPGDPEDTKSLADFARFDPQTKAWTDLPPLPLPRSTHDAVVVGRTLFVVGGWTMKGAKQKSEYVEDMLACDLDRPEAGWRAVPQPFRRRALAVAETGGRIYVLGGLTDAFDVERQVDVYDIASNTWSLGPELPDAHDHEGFSASACTVGGRLYYSGASGFVFRLAADGGEWEVIGRHDQARITHRLLPYGGDSLLAVGGSVDGDQDPTIERVLLPVDAAPSPGG